MKRTTDRKKTNYQQKQCHKRTRESLKMTFYSFKLNCSGSLSLMVYNLSSSASEDAKVLCVGASLRGDKWVMLRRKWELFQLEESRRNKRGIEGVFIEPSTHVNQAVYDSPASAKVKESSSTCGCELGQISGSWHLILHCKDKWVTEA